MIQAKIGLEYSRLAPERWERAVWSIAPPSQFVTWLKISWWSGDVWQPIERWGIWQMRHPRMVHPAILRELKGPSPRSTGHYCAVGYCPCKKKFNAWYGGAARQIDFAQWQLFRETGHYGTRWWTIQGDQGGHRHRLDRVEARVTRIMTRGQISDTPAPGDLPYADFDQRTFWKIAALDRVRMWKHVSDYVHRNDDRMNVEEREEGQAAQRALWAWLESQVKKTVDTIGSSGAKTLKDAAPRILDKQKPLDEDAIHEDFVTAEW